MQNAPDNKRHRILALFSAISALALLLASWSSAAQGILRDAPADTSFSINLFVPSPGPLNFFAVESPEIGDDMMPSVGLMLSYQHRPFVLLNCTESDCSDDSNTIDAVANFATADIMGSFNFLKYFQVGLAVPMTIMHGEGFLDEGTQAGTGDSYTSFVLGDVRIHLKARIIGKDKEDGPSLAFAIIPTLPLGGWTGMGQSKDVENKGAHGYGSDGFLTVVAPKVMFGYRFGSLRSGVSIGALWRQEHEILSTEVGPALTYGGAVGYAIIPEVEIIAELYGNKLLTSANFSDSESAPLLFLGGGRFRVKDFIFNLAAGGGIISGIGVPQFQVIAGATWAPEKEEPVEEFVINEFDIDGDGIDNDSDECPENPEDRDEFQDEDGCPDNDNDNDGIQDGYDSCPMQPEDKDGFRDDDGCPDLDHDEDGILEADDKCPDQAEDFDEFEDADGCPEPDNDKDGLEDGDDFCPNEAEDIDEYEDKDGCPDLDNDADGVADRKDKCPNEAETLNGFKDDDGCPDKGKALVVVTEDRIELMEMVQFKTGSDKLKGKKSFEILDIVASILLDNTAIRVSIEGHTDSKGNATKNRDLSKRRSESVKRYLIGKSVEEHRLETVGWGPDKPIEDNKTRKGRAANRRVEFIVIRQQRTVIQPAGDTSDAPEEAPAEDAGEMDFTSDGSSDEGGAEMDFTAE
ncbi:MAG: OmpA family protein [Deltaproteobacteria bacterium]|nr:OmpA family protein [Deltaproteobacteria bacterium]